MGMRNAAPIPIRGDENQHSDDRIRPLEGRLNDRTWVLPVCMVESVENPGPRGQVPKVTT